jgi:hypothetical protein
MRFYDTLSITHYDTLFTICFKERKEKKKEVVDGINIYTYNNKGLANCKLTLRLLYLLIKNKVSKERVRCFYSDQI